jgi:oligoendopeptidase F
MERNEVAQNLKWRVEDIFPSDEAWEKAFQEIVAEYGNYDFSVFKGKLGDKQTLLDCLRLIDTVSRKIEKVYLYAHLRHDEDVRVSKHTSAMARVGAFISKLFADLAFIEPELTAISDEQLQAFISDPDFADYDYRLQKVVKLMLGIYTLLGVPKKSYQR